MKKRVFISMHYMEIGGAEMSLIGLLQAIDYSKYDVDLFLHSHRGELMQFIPKEVNLLPEIKEYAHIECPIKDAFLDGCWGVLLGRIKAKWKLHRYMRNKGIEGSAAGLQYIADCVAPFLPSLYSRGEYDVAISYLNPHNYVLDKVLAKKKICWIHTDYSYIDINVNQERPIWSAYDQIVSISPGVTRSFLTVFPSLKKNIVEIESILSPSFVRGRANEFDASVEMDQYGDGIRLLSVGRFCEAKNYDNVPEICRCIVNNGLNVRWFLIGYGGYEDLIRKRLKEAGMEEHVFILGKRSNPYPYIKACDFYVQPSRYEGKSVTVREAQMLLKPVIVTNYLTAASQIRDGIDGRIVPMDNLRCAKGIVDFISDNSLRQTVVKYLENHDYGNMDEIEKLYQII